MEVLQTADTVITHRGLVLYCEYLAPIRLGSSPFLKGLKIAIARERSKKARKYERKIGRDGLGYPAGAPNFTVGFFLRRRALAIENNNKVSRQFLPSNIRNVANVQPRSSKGPGIEVGECPKSVSP